MRAAARSRFATFAIPQGWTDVRRFCQALERSGIRSLQPRPIHIGQGGTADSYTIA